MGGVLDNKGLFIDFSKIGSQFGGNYEFDSYDVVEKNVVYLGPYIKQWGHYLLDSCSRLWYMLEHDSEVDLYVFCGELNKNEKLDGNYLELLKLLGIAEKTIIINKPVKFSKVIIPEIAIKKAEYYSEEFGNLFKYCIDNVEDSKNVDKKCNIFLSRTKLHSAVESGNREIDSVFKKNGFNVVYPEREPLHSLIIKMKHANIIASMSGSTAHNLLFSAKNSKCIIVEKHALTNEYQVGMNLACGLSVTYIDANICLLPVRPGSGPFIVCCNKYFEKFLKEENYIVPKKNMTRIYKYVHNYWKRYFDTYHSYPDEWIVKDRYLSIKEAYDDSLDEYGDYITKITVLQKIKSVITSFILK